LRDFLPEIKGLKPTVRLYSKEMEWCSLNPEKTEDIAKLKELIENRRKKSSSWVATAILQSNGEYSNHERLKVLSQIVDKVAKETEGNGVILFPGGWFSANEQEARNLYEWAEENVSLILSKKEENIIICLGIDGRVAQYAKDQIGIAISMKGIEAMGRKFHPAPQEKGHVELAKDYLSKEKNKSRVFDLNGRKYFLCACYDSFGIKQKRIPNFGIDVILDLIHEFYAKGKGMSGEANFARHGLAGVSNQWKCPVFAATVFFKPIPRDWPSGVYWDKGGTYSSSCTYESISIKAINETSLKTSEGVALIRIYNLDVI